MRVLIESQYLPPIASFAYFAQADSIVLEAQENFQKGSYRNRCHLAGANGPLRLSIPLRKGKHSQLSIQQVELAYDEAWHRQHWQAIRSAYSNAPFFLFYADAFQAVYEQKPRFLWEFNLKLLQAVFQALAWSKPIEFTESYELTFDSTALDLRQQISPKRSTPHLDALSFPLLSTGFHRKARLFTQFEYLGFALLQRPTDSFIFEVYVDWVTEARR